MTKQAQRKANRAYRDRLLARGLSRFEVFVPEGDRDLIRSLARSLAEEGPKAEEVRQQVRRAVGAEEARGSIVAALRRSLLAEAEISVERPRLDGREIDL